MSLEKNGFEFSHERVKRYAKSFGYESIAIQGEFCAPNVQGGIYKNGTHFYVYRINVNGKSVDSRKMDDICHSLSLEEVPCICLYSKGYSQNFDSVAKMQDYVEHLWFEVGDPYVLKITDDKSGNLHRHEGI